MRNLSLQRGDAFILVYDVTNAETFEEVRRIRDDIHRVRQTNSVPIVVVGNKIDLADSETRKVSSSTFIRSHLLNKRIVDRAFPNQIAVLCKLSNVWKACHYEFTANVDIGLIIRVVFCSSGGL